MGELPQAISVRSVHPAIDEDEEGKDTQGQGGLLRDNEKEKGVGEGGDGADVDGKGSRVLWKRRCKTCSLIGFVLFLLFTVTIIIGAELERANVEAAENTIDYYSTKKVCGAMGEGDDGVTVATYVDAAAAHDAGALIGNCGDCGFCSNHNDINIYNVTKQTLTTDTTACATKAFLGGEESVRECMDERVGFTEGCNQCWVDNVMCDMRECVFTCIKSLLLGGGKQAGGNNKEKKKKKGGDGGGGNGTLTNENLNDCLLCDEKLCGPAFIECAGANRRRSGIYSDIGRDDSNEVCDVIDSGWWRE